MNFISIKGFGDFVITLNVLERCSPSVKKSCKILIGSHILPLSNALDPSVKIEVVNNVGHDVPALFDLKKKGVYQAGINALHLRRSLHTLCLGEGVVFDKSGVRESFISKNNYESIPLSKNIYLAYKDFINNKHPNEVLLERKIGRIHLKGKRIGIYPFSRVSGKNIKPKDVLYLYNFCKSQGFDPTIVLLKGENLSLSGVNINITTYARTFPQLIDSIFSVDAIISADSLPAHLAYFFDRPCFVVSSLENQYWLPFECFKLNYWSLSGDLNILTDRLKLFLQCFFVELPNK
jgi:hypothetical protein